MLPAQYLKLFVKPHWFPRGIKRLVNESYQGHFKREKMNLPTMANPIDALTRNHTNKKTQLIKLLTLQ